MSKTLLSFLQTKKILVAIISFLACFLIYCLRLNSVIGIFKDDAWYLLLAEALSTGNGYQLLNFPILGIPSFYPPAFPSILAFICYISPNFPENITFLKSISIISMLLLGIMIYYYFQKYRNLPNLLALLIAILTLTCPAYVFLATSTLMSECVFATFQFAIILVIERYTEKYTPSKISYLIVLGGVFAATAMLLRTIAVVIVLSVIVFLTIKRLWFSNAVFITVVIICVVPWMIYRNITFQKPSALIEQQYKIKDYRGQFWEQRAGSSKTITLSDLPARFLHNIKEISELNIGGMLLPIAFRDSKQSGEEVLGMAGSIEGNLAAKAFSWIFAIIAILGFLLTLGSRITLSEIVVFLSLVLIIAWPWWPFRFVLMLFPFLVFYVLTTFQHLCLWLKENRKISFFNDSWLLAKAFLLFLIAFNLFDHISYIQAKNQPLAKDQPQWLRIHKAHLEMFDWINKNTSIDSVITTDNPSMVFLYTRRKTLVVAERDLSTFNVKYLVKTEINPPSTTILGTNIVGKRLIYHNPDFNLMVVAVSK